MERISILGLGLLGTSVGLALRTAGFEGTITGWNRTPSQGDIALQAGAVDAITNNPIQAALESDVTLLAMPIFATLDYMEKLASVLGPQHLVTDVGSTKAQINLAAGRLYNHPDKAAFLPGHPMAGKERGGAELGDASLFREAVWLFTDNASWKRSAQSEKLIQDWRAWVVAMGARILEIDPVRHDEMVAWVSHLPQFVATALSALLEKEVGDAIELKDVGGRGLREMTRLGASPYSMWRDIAATNSEPIQAALLALEQRLAHLRENLRTPELREEFEQANRFRRGT